MSEEKEKNLMIIDTDCGIDDALAIMLALSYKETWKVLAITCCQGNTSVDNACVNVLKVLHLCNESEIPVYRGCDRPLLSSPPVATVHGKDGLGNVGHQYTCGNLTVADGHAVNVLVEMAKKYKGRINLVCLAPLTNVSIAHRIDPEFTSNLMSLTFMGGNIHAVGNITPTAEFNFYCDPEAAHIVVSETKCPTTMVPWETTLNHGIDWDFYEENLIAQSERCNFLKKITAFRKRVCKERGNQGLLDCDVLAVAVVVCPSSVKNTSCNTTMESTCFDHIRIIPPSKLPTQCLSTSKSLSVILDLDKNVMRSERKRIVKD